MSIMGLGAGVATLLTLVGVAMAIPIARDADAQALQDCTYVRSYDHNGDTAIDIIDLTLYIDPVRRFGADAGQPEYAEAFDLDRSGAIDIVDLTLYVQPERRLFAPSQPEVWASEPFFMVQVEYPPGVVPEGYSWEPMGSLPIWLTVGPIGETWDTASGFVMRAAVEPVAVICDTGGA